MAKLVLRDACYKGIENVQTKQLKATPEHKQIVKESNKRIEKNRLGYATAYRNAGSYLSNR